MLHNAGAAGLSDVAVLGQPGCATLPDLSHGDSVSCNISHPLTQLQFDSWDQDGKPVTFSVFATAMASQAAGSAEVTAKVNVSVTLTSAPAVEVVSSSAWLPSDPSSGEP